jgi:hypothetical protein
MIPEIEIWRVADLMLKRYGSEADIESAIRAEELAEAGDWAGEAIWAPDYCCNRSAREHNTPRAGSLTAPFAQTLGQAPM